MNNNDITTGTRVQNNFGFFGTVLAVFPDNEDHKLDIALVDFDEEKRGRVVGKQWHCGVTNLTVVEG